MITELTAEQKATLEKARDEWLAVGLSTEPADRAAAEEGVRLAYQRAGLTPPRMVVWLDSPRAGCIGASMLGQAQAQVGYQVWAQVADQIRGQVGYQVRAQAGAQVRDEVRAQVGDHVWGQVRAQVWGQVRAQVGTQVEDQVADQVGSRVRAQVGTQVGDRVRAQVWDQVGAQVGGAVWGQHDAGFLGLCDAMHRIGVTVDVDGLSLVARNAGWWWPMRDAVILTDRPNTLLRDTKGRLHCTTGPALRYRDGWSIYAIHGVRVPVDRFQQHSN